jgi:hypothetical protein
MVYPTSQYNTFLEITLPGGVNIQRDHMKVCWPVVLEYIVTENVPVEAGSNFMRFLPPTLADH